MKAIDLTGKQFGDLTVLHLYDHKDLHGRYWVCRCSCGQELAVRASNLTSGHSTSCGKSTRHYKKGFADFTGDSGEYDNKLFEKIVTKISNHYDDIIRKCFEQKGFSEQYIREHLSEFRSKQSRSNFMSTADYYHNDVFLFRVISSYQFHERGDNSNRYESAITYHVEMG